MKKSHSATFWGSLLTAVLTGGAAALTLARKFGKFIPGFGPVFAVVDSTMTAIETWMQKQKAEGKPDIAGGLAIALKAAHKDAKVGAWVDTKLGQVKEKIGVDLAEVAAPTPVAASPAS